MKTKTMFLLMAITLAILIASLQVGAGSLEPISPPAPTMYTLEDIYEAVSSGTEPPQPRAVDMFLKIEGVPGESKGRRHQDWIEVLSYSWGVLEATDLQQPDYQDLSITKQIDKSSPLLAMYACAGGVPTGSLPIPYAELEICSSEDPNNCFMEYRITDVKVTSVNAVGYVKASDSRPTEEVTLNYRTIKWTYLTNDGNSIESSWDIDTGAPID